MGTDKRAFTMRMQPENFDKIKYVADHNKRSIAGQIEFLIENCTSIFEKENGPIPTSPNPSE